MKKKINFIKSRGIAFVFSAILIIASITLLATKGLNFGTDFTGGILMDIKSNVSVDLSKIRSNLNNLNIGEVNIQTFGTENDLLINIQKPANNDSQTTIKTVQDSLNETLGAKNLEYRRVEFVGPTVGKELIRAGILAVVLSMGAMLIYIWIRFEWQFGLSAIIALSHDIIATLGLFAITRMEFNLTTVAAILTIAGYSINDTVVVFDRIRENLRKYHKMPLPELLNNSINEMLRRTIFTSFTTLLALFALYLFGGQVIKGFVTALIFGVVVGTYSSIFIASALLIYLKLKRVGQE
jgi:preprotein translocase SecF subunit